jgi:hypothetical protein
LSARGVDRAAVWKLLGEPADQIGSANEPREQVEQGLRWNEKWIYRERGGAHAGRARRIVLWHRNDFVGVFRVGDDGSLAGESDPFSGLLDVGEVPGAARDD